MGREKEYRQRLKYQVSSVKSKTLETQIAVKLRNELGMSHMESQLLSRRMGQWLVREQGFRSPNQIVIEASRGRGHFRRKGKASLKEIKITPFSEEDLDLEFEYGLKTMQAARIARMIEEAYTQDALLKVKQLTLLTNITPTSLRGRLAQLRKHGIYLPFLGMSKKARGEKTVLRSTWVLSRYLGGAPLGKVRAEAAMSKGRVEDILVSFSHLAEGLPTRPPLGSRELDEWSVLLKSTPKHTLKEMLPASSEPAAHEENEGEIEFELRTEYGMSPVKVRAVMQLFGELKSCLSGEREPNTVIYWAVSSGEPAGKPLEACALVPVKLGFIEEKDVPDPKKDPDFNCVSDMKYKKAVRYATQAKYSGGYLTYADLGYLLGIHPAAISELLQKQRNIFIPLRGSECDIGRGITHRRQILRLFMEMYTETQIADRTGHSYESIENYIKEFGTVMLLKDRGLSVPLVRKVTGRSTRLIGAYLELLKEYSKPEYAFRLNYLRKIARNNNSQIKKKTNESNER
jgi:hypothetical protein